jgi:hypothetical protein
VPQGWALSTEDLEDYESEVELQLYREYKDVCPMFRYWVETERRSYLANHVDVQVRSDGARTWFEVDLRDAWVLDMFRTNRFLPATRLLSFKDVVVEELPKDDLDELADADQLELPMGDPADGADPADATGADPSSPDPSASDEAS